MPFHKNLRHPAESAASASPFADAEGLIEKGQFTQASELLERQIKLNPSSVEGYNLLGIAYTNEHEYERAGLAFQHALRLSPSSTKTHNNLGNFYVAQRKLDLAENEFNAVLKLDPTNRDAHYNMGLLLMAKGAPVLAIQQFQRTRPATIESRFNLVRAYLAAGQTSNALQAARQLSAAHKQNVQLHVTLGVLLASAKQYKPALLELEQANALQPETFEILYNLGQAYLEGT